MKKQYFLKECSTVILYKKKNCLLGLIDCSSLKLNYYKYNSKLYAVMILEYDSRIYQKTNVHRFIQEINEIILQKIKYTNKEISIFAH